MICIMQLPIKFPGIGKKGGGSSQTQIIILYLCLLLNFRTDGFCRSFSSIDQVEWTGKAVALDPLYNTIWSYTSETGTIQCHNPIATDIDVESKQSIMSPDLALPVNPGCLVSRYSSI